MHHLEICLEILVLLLDLGLQHEILLTKAFHLLLHQMVLLTGIFELSLKRLPRNKSWEHGCKLCKPHHKTVSIFPRSLGTSLCQPRARTATARHPEPVFGFLLLLLLLFLLFLLLLLLLLLRMNSNDLTWEDCQPTCSTFQRLGYKEKNWIPQRSEQCPASCQERNLAKES